MIVEYLAKAFAIAATVALAATPLARRLAIATGFWDQPGGHKSHRRSTPYLGGLAIIVAADAGAVAVGGLGATTGRVLMVATVLGAVGLLDDSFPIGPLVRLGCQFGGGALILGAGVRFQITDSPVADGLFSLLWVVALTNAFNLVDNMDGLCAGTAALAALGAGGVALASGDVALAATALAICGACVGFLALNLRPAAIFMGDAGSMFLGAAVAAITLAAHPPGPAPLRAVVPLMIIGLPILDTLTVVFGRARRGLSVLQGGRDHLSHRLVALGMRRRGAVRTLLVAQAISVGAALAATRGLVGPWVALTVAAFPLAAVWVRASRAGVYDDPVRGLPAWIGWTLAGGAALVVAISAPAGLAMVRARTPLRVGAAAVTAGIQDAEAGDTVRARQDFAQASAAFAVARQRFQAPGVAAGRVVPLLAVNLRAASVLANVGADLSRDGEVLATDTAVQTLRIQNGAAPVATLTQLAPRLELLTSDLARASAAIHRLPQTVLVSPIRRAVIQLDAKLLTATTQSRASFDAARMVPAILGAAGPRRYLLLFQNSAEARATGGLIGNYGELLAQSGQISAGHFGRLQELNALPGGKRNVPAPADYLVRYAPFSPLQLWQNINLSPDFPSVGTVAMELYSRSLGAPVAGVVGLDPVALSDLLQLTGPIYVPEWPVAITADNVVPITLQTSYDTLSNDRRIAFLGEVGQAVFTAVTTRDLGNPIRIAKALGPAVRDRHLQVYLADPGEEAYVGRLGAAGAVGPTGGDQLLVTTQNASANKVDYYLQRRLQYQVALDPTAVLAHVDTVASVQATLAVALTNGAAASGHSSDALGPYGPGLQAGENLTFLSVYSALDATAATLDGQPLPTRTGSELGLHVSSAFVNLPAGATRTVGVTLAGLVHLDRGGGYTLDIPRQPALGADPVTIGVTVPSGWEVQSAPAGAGWGHQAQVTVDAHGPLRVRLLVRPTGGVFLLAGVDRAGAQHALPQPAAEPLRLSPVAGPPGSALSVLGGGCPSGAALTVSFGNQAVGTVIADAGGGFDTTVSVPLTAGGGPATVAVFGAGCHVEAAFRAQPGVVQAPPATGTPAAAGPWEVAAGLTVLTVVLVVAIRRRRTDRGPDGA